MTATPPLLVAVKTAGAEVEPITTPPKFCAAGESRTLPGARPVPESEAVAGLPLKLPAMLRVPDLLPVAAGVKVTWTEQLEPGPSVAEQVVDAMAKSPVIAGVCSVSATPPLLVAVKVTAADVDPSATAPKFEEAGVMARLAGARPVPSSVAETAPPATFAGMVSRPARVPACDGVKMIPTRQLAPAASELPQVSALI